MLPERVDWKEVIGKVMAAKRWTLPTMALQIDVKYPTLYYLLTKDRQPSWPVGAAIYRVYMEVQKNGTQV
jgi:hypothetical protein